MNFPPRMAVAFSLLLVAGCDLPNVEQDAFQQAKKSTGKKSTSKTTITESTNQGQTTTKTTKKTVSPADYYSASDTTRLKNARRLIVLCDDVIAVLKKINDEATARAAVPKLEPLVKELVELGDQPELHTTDLPEDIKRKHDQERGRCMVEMRNEMRRLRQIPAAHAELPPLLVAWAPSS